MLDAFLFAGRDGLVSNLWSAGRHIVKDGHHVLRDPVATLFRSTMRKLREAL
jgi:formimidoylglutamate deiminase